MQEFDAVATAAMEIDHALHGPSDTKRRRLIVGAGAALATCASNNAATTANARTETIRTTNSPE